jgi:hypothetical protein
MLLSFVLLAATGCSKKTAVPQSTGNALTVDPVPVKPAPNGLAKPETQAAPSAQERGSGMATGRRTYKPIVITKTTDKSSP